MAGAGYKLFNTGDVLTAAQVNTYLQEQVVMVFANATARTTALSGVLAEGMMSYLQDTNAVEVYDGTAWVSIGSSGDITGVTAGTGISGGGTSGTVTITNSMATEITAAGAIIVGTGSGTFDNLPIGTTGQVLTADTTVSPYKVKWATASGSSGPAFEVRRNGNQTLTAATQTKIQFNQEDYDTDNCFDSTTNYRFTPNKAGYYQLNITFVGENSGGSLRIIGSIYKNGSVYSRLVDVTPSTSNFQNTAASLIYFNGSSDYVEGYISVTGTTPIIPDNGTGLEAVFSGVWIRS